MLLRNRFAVSRDLSNSTAMLISLAVEGELRFASDRCPYFQRYERAEYITGGELWGFSSVSNDKGMRTGGRIPLHARASHRAGCAVGPRMRGRVRGLAVYL